VSEITHDDLVESAARWLRKDHCKVSRSDFLADRKKPSRIGIGMGTYRYYLVPEGVAYAFELPPGWGLLEYKNKRNHPKKVKFALQQQLQNWPGEMAVLCSALRRIGGLRKEGISVKVYQWPSKNTATLGIKVKKLITMVANLYPHEGSPCVIPKNKAKDFIRSVVEEIAGK